MKEVRLMVIKLGVVGLGEDKLDDFVELFDFDLLLAKLSSSEIHLTQLIVILLRIQYLNLCFNPK